MQLSAEQIKKLKMSYKYLKSYAKRRVDRNGDPIGWEFTFDTWLEVWIQSGKLDQRGTHEGGYVMARKGDIGPYSPDNVDIITHSENIKFAKSYWKMTEEQKKHLSEINTGKTYSDEHKKKLSETHKKRWESIDKSKLKKSVMTDETKEKIKQANKKRWEEYRAAGKSTIAGWTKPKQECPHCTKIVAGRRWHFDNCKQKI